MSLDEIITTYQENVKNAKLQNEGQICEFANEYVRRLFDNKTEVLKICEIEESISYLI